MIVFSNFRSILIFTCKYDKGRGPVRNTDILQQYEQLIPFWSEVCGPGTEICLYDLNMP